MFASWKDHIVSIPDILRGKPCVKGTRIPASLILGHLAAGNSVDQITREYPDITPEDVAACLDFARELSEYEVAA